MIEIKGKYNEAKIFTDVVDSASIGQVQALCNQEFTAGSRIRLMPDIHAGKGCTIGTTMTITDKVVPNLVGVDIGCGMETTRIRESHIELQKLDKLIYEKIPSGFSIRDKAHRYLDKVDLSELCCAKHVDLPRAEKSIGTLGGGNHFIEVDKDDEGTLYIVVHSGSRHLGVEVADYYQEAGYKVLNRTDEASLQALTAQMKAEGREKEIQKELKKLKNLKQTSIPKALSYVSGELFEQYLHDMKIVQHFAMLNRQAMMDEIVKGIKGEADLSGAEPLRQLRVLSAGKRIGQLCDGALIPPLVQDFAEQCRRYRFRLDGTQPQELTLMIFSKPRHRAISRFLHQSLFLDCGCAQRRIGPDLQRRREQNLMREHWSSHWSTSVEDRGTGGAGTDPQDGAGGPALGAGKAGPQQPESCALPAQSGSPANDSQEPGPL